MKKATCSQTSIVFLNQEDLWMDFPELGQANAPGIEISNEILDKFSKNQSVSQPGKLIFRKNFWMCFPGFANKG